MNEEFTEEIIEEITPTPIEETESTTVKEMNINEYDLASYSAIGLTAGGACIIFSLGVGIVLRILRSSM